MGHPAFVAGVEKKPMVRSIRHPLRFFDHLFTRVGCLIQRGD